MVTTKNNNHIEADILITNDCNFKCKHCLYRNNYQNSRYMTLKDMEVIECFFKSYNVDYHLLGGEPLCNPEFLSIVSYLHSISRYKQILTNGKALSDEIIDELLINNIGSIGFSLDGNKAAHDYNRGAGSFDSVILGIEQCNRHGLYPKISSCVHSGNFETIKEMLFELVKFGVTRILLEYFVPFGNKEYPMRMLTNDEWTFFKEEIRDFNRHHKLRILTQKVFFKERELSNNNCNHCLCKNGQFPIIDSYGNYYPCILFYAVELKMLNIFGNFKIDYASVQPKISKFCDIVYNENYKMCNLGNTKIVCPAILYALSHDNLPALTGDEHTTIGCFHVVEKL